MLFRTFLIVFGCTALLALTGSQAVAQQNFASTTTETTAKATNPPQQTERGLRTKQPPPPIRRDLTAEERGDIFIARKMFRNALDSYHEALVNANDERADLNRNKAKALRELNRESEAREALKVAEKMDKEAREGRQKQTYLPSTGKGFFAKLFIALGFMTGTPDVPEKRDTLSAAQAADQSQIELSMPKNLSLEEKAQFLLENGDPQGAYNIYQSLDNLKKRKAASLWNKIGIAYHQTIDLQAADKCYRKSMEVDPLYAEARNNLGTVFYAQEKHGRAIDEYEKALEISPYSASIHSNLGTAHFARKDYMKASEHYARAVEIDPGVFDNQSRQGTILQQRNLKDQANFHFYLAKVYARKSDVEKALIYMRKALEEGFDDRNKFVQDEDFAVLQEVQEFQQLLAMEVRVL
jgi:tetratricopeptide (TPR) repeat protein